MCGVLVKNAEALERLEQVDTLVVDKTGTLTEGKPALASIVVLDGRPDADALRIVAALEQASSPPHANVESIFHGRSASARSRAKASSA
jgi:Cu+-exporting ATPase